MSEFKKAEGNRKTGESVNLEILKDVCIAYKCNHWKYINFPGYTGYACTKLNLACTAKLDYYLMTDHEFTIPKCDYYKTIQVLIKMKHI